AIVEKLDRGVTLLSGKGAYSGQEKQILLCVVKRRQIVEIKKIIKNIDKTAFVIVTDTRDVFGQGFGDITIDK
ncbi:MAG: YitT family protein, partial [Oscillospiraceae bacterium]